MTTPANNVRQPHQLPRNPAYTFISENKGAFLAIAAIVIGAIIFDKLFILAAPLTASRVIIGAAVKGSAVIATGVLAARLGWRLGA